MDSVNEPQHQRARPPAPYLGGKRHLAPLIAERIDMVPHHCYAEPFIGMGGVFFRRRNPAHVEIINDVSRDVTTLFRVVQRHADAFADMLRLQLTSRAEFERLSATDPDTLTDLERAARFLYLQRTAFSGKVSGRNFGTSTTDAGRFDPLRLVADLQDLHKRLARVTIERLDWSDLIRRYDAPHTLFYLDPPYWGSERDYGNGVFAQSDFREMAAQLAAIEGGFLLSLNDHAGVRETFAAFHIEQVETVYTMGTPQRGSGKQISEVLIAGGRADIVSRLTSKNGPLFLNE